MKNLKCWKKIRKSKGISTWKDDKGNMIFINDTGYGHTLAINRKDYSFPDRKIKKSINVDTQTTTSIFSTKPQALKFAKSYMKNHDTC